MKSWLVAKSTYRRRISSTLFLLLTFGIPLLMIGAGSVSILLETRDELQPLGYVDQTGRLSAVERVDFRGEILDLASFEDLDSARNSLGEGEVGGVLLIPADYFEGEAVLFYGEQDPGARLASGMAAFMRKALLPEASDSQLERLEDPSRITFVASGTGERVEQGLPLVIRIATPAALAIVFVLSVFTSANQMGSAIAEEKEQRSMEIVITSISPRQLVLGKVMGMTLLSLTQIAVWTAGAVAGIGIALLGTLELRDLALPWWALLWAALLGLPGYFLYAVLGAGLGVIAGGKQQARQLAGMLGFLGMAPLYLMGLIVNNLGGPLGVGLSLFPLTAPTISLFRMTLAEVPLWQLTASLAILLISLAGSILLVARIFRISMLMYGQSIRPRAVLRALRQAEEKAP